MRSCNLASINLNHEYFNDEHGFNTWKLAQVVDKMVYYLDRTGTVNQFPTPEHQQWYEQNRPVGIGITGLADVLLRYGIKYGSSQSLEFVEDIMMTIQDQSYETSEKLGLELGVPLQCQKLEKPRRNITTVSIAPTGSIAMIAECSHGIEPIFSPSYVRVDERGEEYLYTHPKANENYFVSAVGDSQATWKEQIDLVATAQQYCDSGISKTINLSFNNSVATVKEAMIYAWQQGCKGITVYRDGSRSYQVLNAVPTTDDVLNANCKDGVCTL
jgi:ribonucleoside-diphosphate reductase alpha chain